MMKPISPEKSRFNFISPTPRELAFLRHYKWFGILAWSFPIAVLSAFEFLPHVPPLGWWLFLGVASLSLLARLRIDDTRRREAQAQFGFIELTPDELHIGRAFKSQTRDNWSDFRGFHLRRNRLSLRFAQTRLLRLNEIENLSALLNTLRSQLPN